MSDTSAPLVSDENALDMKGKLQAGDGDGKLQAGNGNGKVNGAAEALAVGEAEEAVKVKAKVKVKEYPFWTGVRFLVITLLGFLGTINLYALRVNLSIALPCMVFINVTKNDTNASAANENVPAGCFRELTNDSSDPTKVSIPVLIEFLLVRYILMSVCYCQLAAAVRVGRRHKGARERLLLRRLPLLSGTALPIACVLVRFFGGGVARISVGGTFSKKLLNEDFFKNLYKIRTKNLKNLKQFSKYLVKFKKIFRKFEKILLIFNFLSENLEHFE